ncbi:SH3 domain-containing protein [soil metagenome]
MRKLSVVTPALIALIAAPMLSAAPAQAQSGNPLSSIFACQASGNKQAGGAVAGALLGGLLGNQSSNKKTKGRNTVIGAAVGAAAGSYIGCRMQNGDQQRAEAAAQQALNSGRGGSWSNPETGASGRIDVVSTDSYGGGGNQRGVSLAGLRFAPGVEPSSNYIGASGQYESSRRVNLRGAADANSRVVGQLDPQDRFDALARVRTSGADWILAGRNGVAIGYVSESVVQPVYANGGAYASNQPLCRTFDQTITTGGGQPETQRYKACQTSSGEWVVQA